MSSSLCAAETNAGFELRGRQIDSPLQHEVEEPGRTAPCRDFFADSQSVTGSGVKKNVNIEPTRFTVTPAGARRRQLRRAGFQLARRFPDAPSRYRSIASPAATASGLPDSVPA